MFKAGLALLRTSRVFLIAQPPEVRERLDAIIALAGEVSQQATAEALFKFIDDELRFIDDELRRG